MKAVELKAKTDEAGHVKTDYKFGIMGRNVRILILLDDEIADDDEGSQWLKSIHRNPAFDFLNEPEEDIYS